MAGSLKGVHRAGNSSHRQWDAVRVRSLLEYRGPLNAPVAGLKAVGAHGLTVVAADEAAAIVIKFS